MPYVPALPLHPQQPTHMDPVPRQTRAAMMRAGAGRMRRALREEEERREAELEQRPLPQDLEAVRRSASATDRRGSRSPYRRSASAEHGSLQAKRSASSGAQQRSSGGGAGSRPLSREHSVHAYDRYAAPSSLAVPQYRAGPRVNAQEQHGNAPHQYHGRDDSHHSQHQQHQHQHQPVYHHDPQAEERVRQWDHQYRHAPQAPGHRHGGPAQPEAPRHTVVQLSDTHHYVEPPRRMSAASTHTPPQPSSQHGASQQNTPAHRTPSHRTPSHMSSSVRSAAPPAMPYEQPERPASASPNRPRPRPVARRSHASSVEGMWSAPFMGGAMFGFVAALIWLSKGQRSSA